MARKDFMKLALVIALSMAASSAYALQISSATLMGGGSFAPSNNVTIGVVSAAGGYSVNSKHFSGDRTVAGYNLDPRLYFSSGAPVGSTVAEPGASNSYSALGSTAGWSTL